MKKKLFLFGTCFFLLFSLVIFLTYRNIQLKEKVKKLLKELEEQKKSNLNQKEKNEEIKDNHEEADDLSWTLNWKWKFFLVVCAFICAFIFANVKKIPNNHIFIFLLFFFFGLFPVLLAALSKYKDKSFSERYCLLWRSYWKPVVCVTISGLFLLFLYVFFPKTENTENTQLSTSKIKDTSIH